MADPEDPVGQEPAAPDQAARGSSRSIPAEDSVTTGAAPQRVLSDSAEAPDALTTGRAVAHEVTLEAELGTEGNLTIQVPAGVASAFGHPPTVTVTDADFGSGTESQEVVRTAASVVSNEAERLATILSVLDSETVDALITLGRAAAAIAESPKSDEAKLGDLQYLLLQQAHNNELVVAALDQLSDSVTELKEVVERALSASSAPTADDVDPGSARSWAAGIVLYLAAALLVTSGLGALALGSLSGFYFFAGVCAYLALMIQVNDRLPE